LLLGDIEVPVGARDSAKFLVPPLVVVLLGLGPAAVSPSAGEEPSAGARGEAPRSDTDPACPTPYAMLCGPRGEIDDDRARRHKELVQAIEDRTLVSLSEVLGFEPATRAGWAAFLDVNDEDEREGFRRLFRKVHAHAVAARIAPLREVVEADLERLRGIAIERARESQDRRALARLRRARLGWLDLAATDGGDLPRALAIGCGEHLLLDDAWVDKASSTITLCPGFLLLAAETLAAETGEPRAFSERIAFILAHELGHITLGAELTLEDERAAERAADRIGAEILAADLARVEDPAARERYLARAVEPICYAGSDPAHDSGPERIEQLVATEPDIAGALCEDAEAPAGSAHDAAS
jgi:hypothetical protein